jgi:hypothetical protein
MMKMMHKYRRLFNTIKYLKSIQVYYRLYYFAKARWRKITGFQYPLSLSSHSKRLTLQPSIASDLSRKEERFIFLNLSHTFERGIDWNYSHYGKLWTYNLTYFDFLHQPGMSREAGLALIYDFIEKADGIKDGLEPFPISLRGINWIKFLALHVVRDQKIDESLYAHYAILMDNLEYHLLGNHLLENGFSLLFGACYFQDEKLYTKAKEILTAELEEQILDDGAHFELSPMYHQIMLFRVLDCLNLMIGNSSLVIGNEKIGELREMLEGKAKVMLEWLNVISYEDGSIPLLNDSANGIAPTTKQLNDYATHLQLNYQLSTIHYQLTTSGYRKIVKSNYECVIDVGHIGPDYIPGHVHADTFSFELRIDGKPFIVDTGLSTYETNARRMRERGTAAHNTVEVSETNSSEVWGGFRVANRACVTQLEESDDRIRATHDGYRKLGVLHTRIFEFYDDTILIHDELGKDAEAKAYLHFHPDVTEEMIRNHLTIHHSPITNHESRITHYDYALGFNKTLKALAIEISFKKDLKVEITL